jgi:GntR family transcriptional repressor for pyruvate dehydrogenase complex
MEKQAQLEPIRKFRLYEIAVDQIKALILENQYQPGDRLPSERELAEKLCIGRPSVREALRILGLMGLIEIRVGDGTYVKDLSFFPYIDSVVSSIGSRLKMQAEFFLKLWEVRKILEIGSAGLACLRACPTNLETLRQCIQQMEENIKNREAFIQAGIRFHQEIAKATENEILFLLWESLWDMIRRGQDETYQAVRSPQLSIQGHKKIYQALQQGSFHDSQNAMEEHLKFEEKVLLASLKEERNIKTKKPTAAKS